MRKNLGFARFEFYFVISAIGIVILVAIQRYLVLVDETKRLSFEISAKNFSAAIYNYRARWILANQNQDDLSQLNIDSTNVQFSSTGWPIGVLAENNIVKEISITSCLSLWQNFLQSPPLISFNEKKYGNHDYHLRVVSTNTCRYEYINNNFFVDYNPVSGDLIIHSQPFISK